MIYFIANGITDNDRKRAIFLSACGSRTFDLLRNLLQPAKPGEKSFDELVDVLKGHNAPRPSVITQRYKFNTRIRQQAESVSTYVAELKAMAEFCDFPNLEQMLHDQLICGIADLCIQKRLLQDALT
uniref:Retrotransposon gag domain-containing protein n=1 Tax=Amphimedon queenslandica TaxID=400682 RepID=A0A1X7VKL7_AMPQE